MPMSTAGCRTGLTPLGDVLASCVASRPGLWTALQELIALLLAATLVWALLAFPVYKGMPVGYLPVVAGTLLALATCQRRVRAAMERVLSWPAEREFVLALVAVAIGLRVATVLLLQNTPVSDYVAYDGAAKLLASGEGYPPSAYRPPGMAFWLAGLYSVWGPSQLVAQLGNAAIGGAYAWITYVVARQVVATPAARFAALLAAVFPSLVIDATTLDYGPLLGCVLFGTVALFQRRAPIGVHPWWYVVLIGVLLAGAAFLKPIGVLLPFVFGVCYWRRGASAGRAARNTVLMLAAMLLTLAPWSLRNYRLFGRFVPVTTSGGAGLWVTNNPQADGLSMSRPECPAGMNEAEHDSVLWKQAWAYLSAHPGQFARLVPAKAAYQWGTSTTILSFIAPGRLSATTEQVLKMVMNTAWTFVCVLFVIALCQNRIGRSTAIFWPLLAVLAYVWGIHQFYEAQCKYHLPVLPVLFIGAACACLGCSMKPARRSNVC
jgi:4-amino-4-deoxy-L-arabinose transferase-like glycosyltransferase